MPTLYTIKYTRTNLDNKTFSTGGSASTKNLGLSNFVKSGNGVGKPIGKVVSVTMQSYWSATNSINVTRTVKIRTHLVSSAGTLYSAYTSVSIKGNVPRVINTITGATAAHINGLSNIRLECAAYSSYCDLYYRADSEDPQVLTITFYMPSVKYGVNGEWDECDMYYGIDGTWKNVTLCYGLNDVWNST